MLVICLLFLFLLILLDFCVIHFLRCFLWDFLMIKRNKQAMKKNLMQQTKKDQITLSYIGSLLKKNQKMFRVWHCIYLCTIYSLLPQYVLLLIVWFAFEKLFLPIVVLCCLTKTFIELFVRLNMDSNLVSIYSKYSIKKKK